MSQRLWDSLTQEEKAVALKIVEGDKYLSIAYSLGLSPRTVQKRATSIYTKLGTKDKVQLSIAVLQGVRQ